VKYLLLFGLLVSSLFGETLKVGDTISYAYVCENEILYKVMRKRAITVVFNPATDKPYHCDVSTITIGTWGDISYTYKITK